MRFTCLRRLGPLGAGLLALAALVTPLRDANARFLCATTADELREALAQVSDGGLYVDEDSIIGIGPGIYATGGTPFRSEALTSTARLEIMGTWSPNCGFQTSGPPTTVLDAGGVGGVLVIKRPNALVSLKRFVVQNGNADVGGGLQVNYGTASAAMVLLYQLIVRNNHASGNGGGLYVFASSTPDYAPLQIGSSLIADNSSGGDGGGAYFVAAGGYVASLSSLTVASNTAVGSAGGIAASGELGYEAISVIAWGNAPASLRFDQPSTLGWSDVDLIAPGAALAMEEVADFDPMFVAPAIGDYRFGNVPGLARNGPPYLYWPADLNGHPFPRNNGRYRADMGAYMDTIFVYSHEVDEAP